MPTKLKIQKLCQIPVKAAARKSAEKAKGKRASILARLGMKGGKGKNLASEKRSKMRRMREGGRIGDVRKRMHGARSRVLISDNDTSFSILLADFTCWPRIMLRSFIMR